MRDDYRRRRCFFGELGKTLPCHGMKRRLRDLVNQDLKSIGVVDNWYNLCQDRPMKGWFCTDCRKGADVVAANEERTHVQQMYQM